MKAKSKLKISAADSIVTLPEPVIKHEASTQVGLASEADSLSLRELEPTLLSCKELDDTFKDLAGQLAPRSKITYSKDAKVFDRWLSQNELTLETLRRSDVIKYRTFLAENYKETTAGRMLTVTRRLLNEAVKRGVIEKNPALDIRGFKGSMENETPHIALNKMEAKALFEQIDTSTALGKRDYTLILFLLRTGVRREEAAQLDLGDLSTEQGYHVATIRHGKGNKRRKVKVPTDVMRYINNYLEATGRKDGALDAPLFISFRKGDTPTERRLNPTAIYKIVRAYSLAATGQNVTPHGLRASFVTLTLESGARLQQVQYAVGHADPRTTERYQKRKLNLDDNAVDYLKIGSNNTQE